MLFQSLDAIVIVVNDWFSSLQPVCKSGFQGIAWEIAKSLLYIIKTVSLPLSGHASTPVSRRRIRKGHLGQFRLNSVARATK
jgi:hypothetical protein